MQNVTIWYHSTNILFTSTLNFHLFNPSNSPQKRKKHPAAIFCSRMIVLSGITRCSRCNHMLSSRKWIFVTLYGKHMLSPRKQVLLLCVANICYHPESWLCYFIWQTYVNIVQKGKNDLKTARKQLRGGIFPFSDGFSSFARTKFSIPRSRFSPDFSAGPHYCHARWRYGKRATATAHM